MFLHLTFLKTQEEEGEKLLVAVDNIADLYINNSSVTVIKTKDRRELHIWESLEDIYLALARRNLVIDVPHA